MVKRRSMVIGLGTLATGSGAVFSSATFQNSVDSGADFRIVSEPGLTLRRGEAFSNGTSWAYGPNATSPSYITNSGIDFSNLKADNLPVAWANEQEDGSLTVQIARQNNSSDFNFTKLLEVENTGQTDERVGISYGGGYAPIASDGSTPGWFANNYNDPSDQITKTDVQEIFRFQLNGGSTQISPDSSTSDDTPSAYHTLTPGTTIQIDLNTTLTGDQTSVFASESRGGNPFSDSPKTGSHQLLDQITVGTQN